MVVVIVVGDVVVPVSSPDPPAIDEELLLTSPASPASADSNDSTDAGSSGEYVFDWEA